MARRRSDGRHYRPSVPRAAKGGIRAQSQAGAFGSSWWAKRWTTVLDSFQLGARLQRGRRYARQGQVLSIDVGDSKIEAKVQGSRPKPYQVMIRVKPIPREAWKKVAAAASSQAVFASKLLAGEMPQEMEEIFRAAGVSLFPEAYRDLTTDCSCPDWQNPCKHIAAVYYLLGEEFDRDPFLIFRMRGMSREAFLALGAGGTGAPPPRAAAPVALPPEPLPADPAVFWSGPAELPQQNPPEVKLTEAALPRRLGNFPFWRGGLNFHQYLDGVYTRASLYATEVLTAEPAGGAEEP